MGEQIPMELLAPAGGPEQLREAIHFGADAVYLAGQHWGMRAGSRNFSNEELIRAVAYAHARGVAVHVTVNTVMTDRDADALPVFFSLLAEAGADAVIVADLGAIALARRYAPQVAVHVSTQASVMSAAAAEEYARLGARRVVLAREMTLGQIAELRRRVTGELELEAFVHGSMCMAYSGRCLLSADLMGPGRSASHGACAQPCRWAWSLTEEKSGAVLPVEQDSRASYLLSSNDLCMIERLGDLRAAGIDAIKLEGRSKGAYYAAAVTNAYRHVLDGEDAGQWRRELDLVSHRPYSTGFYLGEPQQNPGRVDYQRERRLVGVVEQVSAGADGTCVACVLCRNRANAGGELEVLSPGQPVRSFELDAPLVTNGELYQVRLPFAVEPLDLLCARG
ncbi:U32 family peptidase [Olsenella sp. AM04-33]|uniref:U32 family peptidase n=2 Tax=unclassified Olsenella TaxID=2638792 RepID=UPI000E46E14A|nr:U32 family peptidase [Olsenella sp. AM04-33]RHK01496.1 U32 family peptidase [Olsenella sp. AM04-33]